MIFLKRNRTTSLLATGIVLTGLLSCQLDEKPWGNPADPDGTNYHRPVLRAISDSQFVDSSHVELRVVGTSTNSTIRWVQWTVDGRKEPSFAFESSDSVMKAHVPGLSEESHVVALRVQDGTGLWSDWDTVRFRVWNEPPKLAKVRDTTLAANKMLSVKLSASDVDGKIAKIYWGVADGTWTDSSGIVVLAPKSESTKRVYWMARDDLGKTTVDSFVATFTNQAPTLTKVRDTALSTRRSFVVTPTATDPDGLVAKYLFDTIGGRWDSSSTAPKLTISSTTERVRTILWAARDTLGKITADTFVVRFTQKPVVTPVEDTSLSTSKTLVVALNARDVDPSGKVVKYLWSTSGNNWTDSSSEATLSLSDRAGGTTTVRWAARNDLGEISIEDTFQVTFVPIRTPVIIDFSTVYIIASANAVKFNIGIDAEGFTDLRWERLDYYPSGFRTKQDGSAENPKSIAVTSGAPKDGQNSFVATLPRAPIDSSARFEITFSGIPAGGTERVVSNIGACVWHKAEYALDVQFLDPTTLKPITAARVGQPVKLDVKVLKTSNGTYPTGAALDSLIISLGSVMMKGAPSGGDTTKSGAVFDLKLPTGQKTYDVYFTRVDTVRTSGLSLRGSYGTVPVIGSVSLRLRSGPPAKAQFVNPLRLSANRKAPVVVNQIPTEFELKLYDAFDNSVDDTAVAVELTSNVNVATLPAWVHNPAMPLGIIGALARWSAAVTGPWTQPKGEVLTNAVGYTEAHPYHGVQGNKGARYLVTSNVKGKPFLDTAWIEIGDPVEQLFIAPKVDYARIRDIDCDGVADSLVIKLKSPDGINPGKLGGKVILDSIRIVSAAGAATAIGGGWTVPATDSSVIRISVTAAQAASLVGSNVTLTLKLRNPPLADTVVHTAALVADGIGPRLVGNAILRENFQRPTVPDTLQVTFSEPIAGYASTAGWVLAVTNNGVPVATTGLSVSAVVPGDIPNTYKIVFTGNTSGTVVAGGFGVRLLPAPGVTDMAGNVAAGSECAPGVKVVELPVPVP